MRAMAVVTDEKLIEHLTYIFITYFNLRQTDRQYCKRFLIHTSSAFELNIIKRLLVLINLINYHSIQLALFSRIFQYFISFRLLVTTRCHDETKY